jgi:hypothetical protein
MSLEYDPTSELRQAWQAAIAICKPGVGYNEIGGVIEAVVAKVRSPLSHAYLTPCIYCFVLESELPHKTDNSVFCLAILSDNLKMLWGS